MTKKFKHLLSYIPPEFESGNDYIEKMEIKRSIWGNNTTIFTTVQLAGKDVVNFLNGWWKWHCANGTFKRCIKNALYLHNAKRDILTQLLDFKYTFDPVIGF